MSRSIFGWSYPPGCSGPPDDAPIPPESEAVYGILEAAGVDEAIIEQVCKIVEDLAERAAEPCQRCLANEAKAEEEWAKRDDEYWASLPTPTLCQHMRELTDCNACLSAGDMAYDAARERKLS